MPGVHVREGVSQAHLLFEARCNCMPADQLACEAGHCVACRLISLPVRQGTAILATS
jgi:hypothetical protein